MSNAARRRGFPGLPMSLARKLTTQTIYANRNPALLLDRRGGSYQDQSRTRGMVDEIHRQVASRTSPVY